MTAESWPLHAVYERMQATLESGEAHQHPVACQHAAEDPGVDVVLWDAWAPGRLRCEACAAVVAARNVERCDHCRRRGWMALWSHDRDEPSLLPGNPILRMRARLCRRCDERQHFIKEHDLDEGADHE